MINATTIVMVGATPGDDPAPVQQLRAMGYRVAALPDHGGSLEAIQAQKPDLVIITGNDGEDNHSLDLIHNIRGHNPLLPILLLARASSEAFAIAALKAGASDYFKLPVVLEDIKQSIEAKLKLNQGFVCRLPPSSDGNQNGPTIIGESDAMLKLKTILPRLP
jgi:DNA-binding NtrC family response regulator